MSFTAQDPEGVGSRCSSECHAQLLLAQINKMRLRSDLCDVRMRVGGRVFHVHRLVLAASGPYFSALFSSGMSEAREEEVHISGVEPEVFQTLLEFIYTGTQPQTPPTLPQATPITTTPSTSYTTP